MCQISGVVFRLVTIRCYRNTTNVRRSKESLDNTAHGDSSAATPCILPRSLSWIPTECFPGHPASCVWDSTSFSFSVERIIDRVFPVSGSPLVVFNTGIHTIRCLHVTAASHCTDGVFRPLWCSPSLDSSEVDAAALGQVLCQGVWLLQQVVRQEGVVGIHPTALFLCLGSEVSSRRGLLRTYRRSGAIPAHSRKAFTTEEMMSRFPPRRLIMSSSWSCTDMPVSRSIASIIIRAVAPSERNSRWSLRSLT